MRREAPGLTLVPIVILGFLLLGGASCPPKPPQPPEDPCQGITCPPGEECKQGQCAPIPIPPTPAKDVGVKSEMLLRRSTTDPLRLTLLDGTPHEVVGAAPCCMSWMIESQPKEKHLRTARRPSPWRVNGVEKNTGWPYAHPDWMDYTRKRGGVNMYHFRGPWEAGIEGEEWNALGGAYIKGTLDWNQPFWENERNWVHHAAQNQSRVEKAVIDLWGCKVTQQGWIDYTPWPDDAVNACGRTWHPIHESYTRKVVDELTCMGNVVWVLGVEPENIPGYRPDWFRKWRDVIRDQEQKSLCLQPDGTRVPFVHLIGSELPEIQPEVDYSVTHQRAPLQPLANRFTECNEHNPELGPLEECAYFSDARKWGGSWWLWRGGASDTAYGQTLDCVKGVLDGGVIPPPPPPPTGTCPKPLAPGAYAYLNNKIFGQGLDSTVRVRDDPAFCQMIHGVATNDCHLEGWMGPSGNDPNARVNCEMELLGGCPVWQYKAGLSEAACLQVGDPLSCDHFGSAGGGRDDPHTPIFEGTPSECGRQRDASNNPMAGFFVIAHGLGQVRACKPDGSRCGPWVNVDH